MSFTDKVKHKADELGLSEKAHQLMDEAKKLASHAKEKAGDLAVDHRDRVESALDTTHAKIDEKTEGKYSDKIAKAKEQVTKGVDKIAEGSARHPSTWSAPAAATGGFDPLIDEEEVAEEVLSSELDPEAPLDAPPEAAAGMAGARPQRAYDASGEPIDDLSLDPDGPDAPGTSSSGSW